MEVSNGILIFVIVVLADSCTLVQCGSSAYCRNGICKCYEGFTGDPHYACHSIYEGQYPQAGCENLMCHPNATCSGGQCICRNGFEGDGFIDCWRIDPANLCNCGRIPAELAGCSNGRCNCRPGFRKIGVDHCEECRGDNECAENASCDFDQDTQHYRCKCRPGYLGDGAIACIAGEVANRTRPAECRIPCHRLATCDENNGRCRCRPGFQGNGYTYCDFDCSQCLSEASCAPTLSQCVCPPGYTGDGVKYCRPTGSPGRVNVRIENNGGRIQITEGSGPLDLICIVTGDLYNVYARWLPPNDVGVTTETVTRDGKELRYTLLNPQVVNSGRFICQAGNNADSIDVKIESAPKALPKKLFLTSDNGIISVQTQSESPVAATVWHISENNSYHRIAIAVDCNDDRLIYTSDMGRALRWSSASLLRLETQPMLVHQDFASQYTWIAVDSTCGNVFAVDAQQKRIVVVNPEQPGKAHTFKQLSEKPTVTGEGFTVTGIAVHPRLSLVYWAQNELLSSSNQTSHGAVIYVASMWNSNYVTELLRLQGEPITINLAASEDSAAQYTAGRLCWLERRPQSPFPQTELHCAEIEPDGRQIRSDLMMRVFSAATEPSTGLLQDDDSILWSSLYKRSYELLNPSKSVHVNGVCCSNDFQSLAMQTFCRGVSTNECSFENGRCRFFCLPGGRSASRVCKCPDDLPNCLAEAA